MLSKYRSPPRRTHSQQIGNKMFWRMIYFTLYLKQNKFNRMKDFPLYLNNVWNMWHTHLSMQKAPKTPYNKQSDYIKWLTPQINGQYVTTYYSCFKFNNPITHGLGWPVVNPSQSQARKGGLTFCLHNNMFLHRKKKS